MSFFTEERINRAIVCIYSELQTIAETGDYTSQTIPELPVLFIAHAAGQVEETLIRGPFFTLLTEQTSKERLSMCRRLLEASNFHQKNSLRSLIPEMEQCYSLGIHTTTTCAEDILFYSEDSLGYGLIQTLLEIMCGVHETVHI